jgi:asparagine synthase (glutamine-hydrolysing)
MTSRLNVVLDPAFGWRTQHRGSLTVHAIGDSEAVDQLCAVLERMGSLDDAQIARQLRENRGLFAAIVETPSFGIACVDKIRSYPIFYAMNGSHAVSNSARLVKGHDDVDEMSLLEFITAGYVTGTETLYRDLKQIRAGEFLAWDEPAEPPRAYRYYCYRPDPDESHSQEELLDQLAHTLERVFQRLISVADGAPIWVPLSGGYDSRLILCKLHELGYERLHTFTYGPRGNFEARVASKVARTLNVPWHRLPSQISAARSLFDEDYRNRFWELADGLHAVPNMREYEPLIHLVRNGIIPENAVVINGQTGDFITGGHIPDTLATHSAPTVRDLTTAIIDKHYSLWTNWKTPTVLARIEDKIRAVANIPGGETMSKNEILSLYETWEYQERQAKWVVNDQRLYDFLRLDWALPFWDGELLDFWERVPFRHKVGQSLFKTYLRRYDYAGLFAEFDPYVWRWPLHMMWVVPVARAAGIIFGNDAKTWWYALMRYFGHYHNQYATIGLKRFLKTFQVARSPVSYWGETWLQETGCESEAGSLAAASQVHLGGRPVRHGVSGLTSV